MQVTVKNNGDFIKAIILQIPQSSIQQSRFEMLIRNNVQK